MKKKVLAALFAAVMACSLMAGCGSTSSAPAAAEEKTEEAIAQIETFSRHFVTTYGVQD